jgi:predicted dehydrogenase
MKRKVQWGVLGAANIAMEQVIPALKKSRHSALLAIASRNLEKAREAAKSLQIPKYYGSYQELIDDKEIEAVYIPLPNHLHVEWAINALKAGKHVLVEKPIAMSSSEAKKLKNEAKKHPDLKIAEAFMYKHHPQWVRVKEMIDNGAIGLLKTIQSSFSFFDDDPKSIVNNKEFGGGSLMDIGCYPISISRFLFDTEPTSVLATIDYHPEFEVDILASGILEFESGSSSFFSGIQLTENQQVQIFGTEGSIEFELPFNPPNDKFARLWWTKGGLKKEISFEICNQYALQVDAFSLAIMENKEVATGLEDAINNMIVIEKLIESDELGKRINL